MDFRDVLVTAVAPLDGDFAKRAFISRVFASFGYLDAPKVIRCSWAGAPATLYAWVDTPAGSLILVANLLLYQDEIEDKGAGNLCRCAPPARQVYKQAPLLDTLSPGARKRIVALLERIRPALADAPRLSIEALPPERQAEAWFWVKKAKQAFNPMVVNEKDVTEGLTALLEQDVEDLGLPEGV